MSEMMSRFEALAASPLVIAVATLLGALIVGRLLVRGVRLALRRAAGRTRVEWDDELVGALATPMSLLVAVIAFRFTLPWLPLEARGVEVAEAAIAVVTTAAAVWLVFGIIDVGGSILERRPWAVGRPASRSLIAITGRFAKVVVVVLGAMVGLAQLGVSVASLVAGLGIGGLAIALAAQKTVENLFGTLSIGVDQPMREGDFVKLYDFVGTVEQIGLRSTRVRTLDRTVITIPNGELANQRIESFTARDRIRLSCVIGLVYQTSAAQVRAVLAGFERVLREHPKIWPDAVVVRFRELAASSLDVEVMAWFQTADWNEFTAIRQDVLLAFLEVVEQAGTSIAYPTQTLHVQRA